MIRIITVLLVLFSSSAMAAVNVNGQKVGVTVDSSANKSEVVKAPQSPSVVLANSSRWPCGGFTGIGAQGQYAGVNLGGTKDSKNCIAWMLATQSTNPQMKEAYLCQMKVHRKARASIGKPCVKAQYKIPRPTYR